MTNCEATIMTETGASILSSDSRRPGRRAHLKRQHPHLRHAHRNRISPYETICIDLEHGPDLGRRPGDLSLSFITTTPEKKFSRYAFSAEIPTF